MYLILAVMLAEYLILAVMLAESLRQMRIEWIVLFLLESDINDDVNDLTLLLLLEVQTNHSLERVYVILKPRDVPLCRVIINLALPCSPESMQWVTFLTSLDSIVQKMFRRTSVFMRCCRANSSSLLSTSGSDVTDRTVSSTEKLYVQIHERHKNSAMFLA